MLRPLFVSLRPALSLGFLALAISFAGSGCADTSEATGAYDPSCAPSSSVGAPFGPPREPGEDDPPVPSGPTGAPPAAGTTSTVDDFGDNPGKLRMHFYAPKTPAADPSVVVALHGCTQSAQAYEAAGWNELADERGFFVVYPEQVTGNNFNRCFRWFEPAQIARGGGEAASIAAMAEYAKRATGAKRAFVTGLSAGGAMTAVMLATYPDVFEAGAVMAGLPYRCASGMVDAYSCMSPGRTKTGDAWGDLVRAASSVSAKARLQVWHGTSDATVKPMNAGELAKQWANVGGANETPSKTDKVGSATHKTYLDPSGKVQVETYEVPGMSHGVAVDPKGGCGKAGAFVLDTGLCSSKLAADFFGI